jgi:hypothetical protein
LFTNSTLNEITAYDINLNCGEGKYCPSIYKNENTTCYPKILLDDRLEGESCKNNTDCASLKCISEKCVALSPKAACHKHSECGIGYYCGKLSSIDNTNNCLLQIGFGQKCESDFDCFNNMACRDQDDNSANKTCARYFSLKDGSRSSNSLLCENMKTYKGVCVSTKLNETSGECSYRNGTIQTECKYQIEGMINSNETSFTTKCKCSKAYYDKQFCEYDTKELSWQRLISYLKEYYNHDVEKIHTLKRHAYYYDLKKHYLTVTEYPLYKDTDDCAVNIELASSFNKLSFIILGFIMLILN